MIQALCALWVVCLGRLQEVGGKEHAEEACGIFTDWARSTTPKESALLLNFEGSLYKNRPSSLSCSIQSESPLLRTVSGHRGYLMPWFHARMTKSLKLYFILFFKLFYCCLIIVVSLFPHYSPLPYPPSPPTFNPPPHCLWLWNLYCHPQKKSVLSPHSVK